MTNSKRKKLNKFLVILIILAMVIPSILTGLVIVFGG